MTYFKVVNFDKHQHYKDRNPPWIKLYNSLLGDYEYQQLPDASRSHLFAIWLLASRSDNKLPYDQKWIATNIFSTSKVDLELLKSMGFIEELQTCSNMLADCKQSAIPETETETETEKRESREETDSAEVRNKRKTKLPLDFIVSDKIRDWSKEKGFPDPDSEFEAFTDYHTANASRFIDWEAALRTWVRNSKRINRPTFKTKEEREQDKMGEW